MEQDDEDQEDFEFLLDKDLAENEKEQNQDSRDAFVHPERVDSNLSETQEERNSEFELIGNEDNEQI